MASLNRKGSGHPFQSACASKGVTMMYSEMFMVCWKASQDFFDSFLSVALERSEYPTGLWGQYRAKGRYRRHHRSTLSSPSLSR